MSSQDASSLHISSSSRASTPSSALAKFGAPGVTESGSIGARPTESSLASALEPKRTASLSLARTFSQVCFSEGFWPSRACFSRKRDKGASPKHGRRQPMMRGPCSFTSSLAISCKASASSLVKLSTSSSSSLSSPASGSSRLGSAAWSPFMRSRTAGSHSSTGGIGTEIGCASSVTPKYWNAASRKGPTTVSEVSTGRGPAGSGLAAVEPMLTRASSTGLGSSLTGSNSCKASPRRISSSSWEITSAVSCRPLARDAVCCEVLSGGRERTSGGGDGGRGGPESFDAFFWLLPDSADAVIGSESLASASLSTTALAASLAASGWAMLDGTSDFCGTGLLGDGCTGSLSALEPSGAESAGAESASLKMSMKGGTTGVGCQRAGSMAAPVEDWTVSLINSSIMTDTTASVTSARLWPVASA
mmetsp:Transcript_128487/g.304952  ORF Transcript_128487/g.304952 Transcript_128487/m.304952 type:complete len:419 (+) Transcript_128487:414-1670(+)